MMTDALLAAFASVPDLAAHMAARPNRGEETCTCCKGQGNHADGSRCERCDGTGVTEKRRRPEPNCPGQPAPRRRHWRGAAARPMHWYHGSTDELAEGEQVQPAAALGRKTRGGPGDENHVWISNDPHRAGAYGAHIYEVTPHENPLRKRGPSDEHRVSGATVVRELSDEEARNLSPSYQAAARAYEKRRREGARRHTWFAAGRGLALTAAELFHGSDREEPFSRFDFGQRSLRSEEEEESPLYKQEGEGKSTRWWNSRLGSHFTSEHGVAKEIAGQMGGHGNVYHVDLRQKNPKHYASEHDLAEEGVSWARKNGYKGLRNLDFDTGQGWHYADALQNHPKSQEIAEGFRAHLQRHGYDGITYGNEYEGTKGHLSAIAFHPDQAKITETHGAHDPCRYDDDDDDMQHEASDTSYCQQHQGPDEDQGEALHEIGTKGTFPDDVHQHPDWYGAEHGETLDAIHKARGRPYSKVAIYRSLPSPHREINTGDWVATAAAYARSHGKETDPKNDWPVVKAVVRADQVRNQGDSLEEWSYHGPTINRALLHFGGGANHKGKSGRGRTDAMPSEHEPLEMRQHYSEMLTRARAQKKDWQTKVDAWNQGKGDHPGEFRYQASARIGAGTKHVMYHSTPKRNRSSITERGLLKEFSDDPEEYFQGTYLTPTEPQRNAHEDIWRVNTEGLPLERDDADNFHEFGGSYYTRDDIPPHRLTLHHQAAIQDDGVNWEEEFHKLRYRKRKEPLMHRGIAVELPPDLHNFVHDQFQSRDRQARALAEHIGRQGLGMHWSTDEKTPRHFADWERKHSVPGSTKVILHAALPDIEHIETDKEKLAEGGVFRHDNWMTPEHEVPMKAGAPVRLRGVTWYGYGGRKRSGELYGHEGHIAAHRPELEFRTRPGKRQGISHVMISAHGEDGGQLGHVRMTNQGRTLDDLYVKPGARGRGIGHALVGEAVRQFGHNTISLHASPFRQGKADKGGLDKDSLQALYAAHGFEQDPGRAEGYMSRRSDRHHEASWREEREARGDRWHEYGNRYLPDTVHRGITVRLPDSLHEYVHNESVPRERRAQALSEHFSGEGLGMHWTPHLRIAERAIANAASGDESGFGAYRNSYHEPDYDDDYGEHDWEEEEDQHATPSHTDVIFHARHPAQRSIVRNRDELERHDIGWEHSHDEDERPVKSGKPLFLQGISWRPHESQYPNEPFEHHDFDKPVRHTAVRHTGVSYEELDRHLENWFHPQQLDAREVIHPKSGYPVKEGEERRLHHPANGEGPAHFEVNDHGSYPDNMNMLKYPRRNIRTEPIQHVYRGVSEDEWKQARERGHLQSDQRGTIAPWEGTNAAVNPRSAVSYLPHRGTGHVLKIRVHPDDGWFTHSADSYVRTRSKIPLDRVEAVSPPVTKGGKYGGNIEKIGSAHKLPAHIQPESKGEWAARQLQERLDSGHPTMQRLAARPGMRNPYTGSSEWFHGTQAYPEEVSQHGLVGGDEYASGRFENPESEEGGHWNALLGTHFTADHDVAREFASGEHSSGANERHEYFGRPVHEGVIHANLNIRNPKIYASEHDMDHEVYEHEFRAGNHPRKLMPRHPEEAEEMWPTAYGIHKDYGRKKIPASTYGEWGTQHAAHPLRAAWISTHPDKYNIAMRFRRRLQDQGYDGIIYGNEYEKSPRGADANKSAIAFRPDQIHVTQHHLADQPHMSTEEGELHQRRLPGPGQRELPFREGALTAAWIPSSGIFAPTTGLDPVLFDPGGELHPEVRRDIMERLDQALRVDGGVTGSDWQSWTHVYLAGGSASEWAGRRPGDQGARDLDVLLGINYEKLGEVAGRSGPGLGLGGDNPDGQTDAAVNRALRAHFNDQAWHPGFGGTWALTGYVNPHAYNIHNLRPYAAYNLTTMRWAVRPPHLPEHSAADFPPALLQQARAAAMEARAILRLPEPFRSQQAKSFWDRIHAERSRAFSQEGAGWEDPGNVIEKWIAYSRGHILDKIRDLAYGKEDDAPMALGQGMTTSELAHAS
jgi:GNAT superfamily N-acetyltransferase